MKCTQVGLHLFENMAYLHHGVEQEHALRETFGPIRLPELLALHQVHEQSGVAKRFRVEQLTASGTQPRGG